MICYLSIYFRLSVYTQSGYSQTTAGYACTARAIVHTYVITAHTENVSEIKNLNHSVDGTHDQSRAKSFAKARGGKKKNKNKNKSYLLAYLVYFKYEIGTYFLFT